MIAPCGARAHTLDVQRHVPQRNMARLDAVAGRLGGPQTTQDGVAGERRFQREESSCRQASFRQRQRSLSAGTARRSRVSRVKLQGDPVRVDHWLETAALSGMHCVGMSASLFPDPGSPWSPCPQHAPGKAGGQDQRPQGRPWHTRLPPVQRSGSAG